jgi:hypothetical protein
MLKMIKLTLTNFNSVLYCTNWLPGSFTDRLITVERVSPEISQKILFFPIYTFDFIPSGADDARESYLVSIPPHQTNRQGRVSYLVLYLTWYR